MITTHEPSSTRLINVPVMYNNLKYKLLMYTNDMEVINPELDNMQHPFNPLIPKFNVNFDTNIVDSKKNIGSRDITNNIVKKNNNALMIVPIPNASLCENFGLIDVTTDSMKSFRKNIFDLFPDNKNLTFSTNSYSLKSFDKLKVHNVGNYSISVSPNLHMLKNNIDWSYFTLPDNFEQRLNTLTDKKLYPEINYAYIVAKANKSVKNDGFAVVYPDPGYDYFPTAHENLNVFMQDYDVKCYNFTRTSYIKIKTNNPKILLDGKNYYKSDGIKRILDKLLSNNKITMTKEGDTQNFEVIDNLSINHFEMNGKYINQNIII